MQQEKLLLHVEHVSKSFGITRALKGVHFSLRYGQIHGLIGENGSGKSTLATILAAIQTADEGEMYLEGEVYKPVNALDATAKGICMILQEMGTFDRLTVAQNIFAGRERQFTKYGVLNTAAMNKEAQKILDEIQASHIRASMPTAALTFEDRKLVELARAMYTRPKVLIVDETSTALSRDGRQILYQIMESIKKNEGSVIFISHDIDELMEICDTLTVLRDGDYICTFEESDFCASEIRKNMVGREIADNFYRTDFESCKNEEVAFSMEHVYSKELRDISFQLKKGEILGFGGLADCGMHALGNIAFGLTAPDLGAVRLGDGTEITGPEEATKAGVAYLSKNRDAESLMISANILDNICLASYNTHIRKGPFIWGKQEREFAKKCSDTLEIKMRDLMQYVLELSGGNKQKVALAKWIGFGADVYIMDCPTRGIDIGVKSNIYKLMIELKNAGKSIILISEELPEVIGMSDRILILKDGTIRGEFLREEHVTELQLIDYMI